MATFFNNFSDFKPYIGSATVNFDIKVLESYITDAIDKNLRPHLGDAYVDDLITKWDASSKDAAFLAVLPKVKSVLTQFALLYWSADSKLSISDAGITRIEDEKRKSAYQWQNNEWVTARKNNGWQRLYQLIVFLETNIADAGYTLYEASAERAWIVDRMIWKQTEFAKVKSIENFETIIKLLPYLTIAEDDYLKDAITTGVFDELKANPATPTNAKAYRYAITAIVNQALNKACTDLNFRIGANGLFIDTVEANNGNINKQNQTTLDSEKFCDECEEARDEALFNLLKYLDATSSLTVYSTYYTKLQTAITNNETLAEVRTNLGTGTIPVL